MKSYMKSMTKLQLYYSLFITSLPFPNITIINFVNDFHPFCLWHLRNHINYHHLEVCQSMPILNCFFDDAISITPWRQYELLQQQQQQQKLHQKLQQAKYQKGHQQHWWEQLQQQSNRRSSSNDKKGTMTVTATTATVMATATDLSASAAMTVAMTAAAAAAAQQ